MRKNVLKRLYLSVLPLCLLSLMITPVFGQANPKHTAWTTELTDFYVWNQCNGEYVICGGTAKYFIQQVAGSSGMNHWIFRGSHNLRGIGLTTGKMYQVVSTFTQHFNQDELGYPYEWTFMNTSPLISQGEDENMVFTIRNHVTINANGDWTVSFSDVSIECR